MAKMVRLLFPSDLSELCALAIPNFAKLTKLLGAELTVLHVVDTSGFYYDVMDVTYRRICDIEAEKLAAIQRQFEAFLSHLSTCIPIRSVVRSGKIADTISTFAMEEGYDAILLPTTHHNRLYCAMKKSLTAKLMDDSDAAILTIDSSLASRDAYEGSVVCALASHEGGTLGETNRRIVESARYVAEKFGSELVFVHVQEKEQAGAEDANERLTNELQEICRATNLKTKCRLEKGDVPRAISEVVWQEKATLLVTGRNHRQALFGATQSRVLDIVHLSPCPVVSILRIA